MRLTPPYDHSLPRSLPLSGPTQALLHSTAVHEKIAATVNEEVERKVQEKLKQVQADTTALRDQLLREMKFMAHVVSGGIQGIEDKVRLARGRPS